MQEAEPSRKQFFGEPNKKRKRETGGSTATTLPLSKAARQINDHSDQAALLPSQWQQGHMLDWMLRPFSTEHFIKHHMDQRPLHISRQQHQTYFDGLLTKSDIHQLLETQQLQYDTNVDVTSYTGGKRRNLNHNGWLETRTGEPEVASAATVMQRFEREGCSVRILHPQRWVEPIYKLLSYLEDELRSPVGCNAYLTPPSSQGFAPHWDDIDAFVLQVEGSKRWRLYAPQNKTDLLPLDSSRDLRDEELGKLLLEVVLQPGDLLYMPRGCIHQAQALPQAHSLHLTVSANQHCSWADLFQVCIPRALELAIEESLGLRRSLPFDMSRHMGLVHEGSDSAQRAGFSNTARQLLQQVMDQMPLDAAADRLSVHFIQQRLPPYGLTGEADPADLELSSDSKISMVRPGIATMTVEEDCIALYHCLSNPRVLHAAGPDDKPEAAETADGSPSAHGRLEFDLGCGEVIECLLASHSSKQLSFVLLEQLLDSSESGVDVFEFLSDLYSQGLIHVE
ncbi:hypothetical protein ABBQ32_013606 [Trebouxia sp. C0010 RCD-2024]